MNPITCPSRAEIDSFLLGEADDARQIQLESHILGCPDCSALLQTISGEDTLTTALKSPNRPPGNPPIVERLLVKLKSQLGSSPAVSSPTGESTQMEAPGQVSKAVQRIAEPESSWLIDILAPAKSTEELGYLGQYRILKILGKGGMGAVLLAEDSGLQRQVALKVLLPDIAEKTDAKERFLREARVAAKIEHDNIVSIYQVGEDRGIPFIAMQLLKGAPLDEWFKVQKKNNPKSPLSAPKILKIGREVALGLAAAHARGLIHRDIKPANIWLDASAKGRAKILDFGLARSSDATGEHHLTQTGTIMGTPAYMAPEQARGQAVDHRCDLFSLGSVLYVLCTGQLPFKGSDTLSILTALAVDTPTAPDQVNPEIPKPLSDLVMKLLSKKAEDRIQTADEVVTAIQRIERGLSQEKTAAIAPTPALAVPAPIIEAANPWSNIDDETEIVKPAKTPTPPREKSTPKPQVSTPPPKSPGGSKKRLLAAAAGAILLLIAGVVFFFPTKEGTVRIEINDPEIEVSVKGTSIVLKNADKGKDVTLEPGEKTLKVTRGDFSFDTDKFQLKNGEKITVKVEMLQGKIHVEQDGTVIADKSIPKAIANNPTKTKDPPLKVVEPKQSGKWVFEPLTLALAPRAQIDLPESTWREGPKEESLPGLIPRPAILKDRGRWQLALASGPTGGLPLDSFASFSPDGKWVAMLRSGYVHIFDSTTGELKVAGKRLGGTPLAGGWPTITWSPDSNWVRCGDHRGFSFDNGSMISIEGVPSPVGCLQHADIEFGWNPKHRLFAARIHGAPDQVRLIDPAQAKGIEIEIPGVERGVWSPDGNWLLLITREKTAQLFGRDGKAGPKLEGTMEPSILPAWNPDSSFIVGARSPQEMGLWRVDGGTTGGLQKHEKPLVKFFWRPDGKQMITVDAEGGMHAWSNEAKAEAKIETGIRGDSINLTWAADGIGFFIQDRYYARFEAKFTQVPGLASVSPDGKRILTPPGRGKRSLTMQEFQDGKPRDEAWTIPFSDDVGYATTFSKDGKRLCVFSHNQRAIYDVTDPKKMVNLGKDSFPEQLIHGAFSPKGDLLAVASARGEIYLCDASGRRLANRKTLSLSDDPLKANTSHPGHFRRMVWHPDGRHLLAISYDQPMATIFDTVEGKAVASTTGNFTQVDGSFLGDGDTVLLTSINESALWRWQVEREPREKFDPSIVALPSPDGKFLIARPSQASPVILSANLKSRTVLNQPELQPQGNRPVSICWLPDSKHFVAIHGTVCIYSLEGKKIEDLKLTDDRFTGVDGLKCSLDGRYLLGFGQYVSMVIDLAERRILDMKELPQFGLGTEFSPHGDYLLRFDGSTIQYWHRERKTLDQIALLLPNQQFARVSAAGEILDQSETALQHLRYLTEEKSGELKMIPPSEFKPTPLATRPKTNSDDPHRTLAKKVLERGGVVDLQIPDGPSERIEKGKPLPREPFRVAFVAMTGSPNEALGDAVFDDLDISIVNKISIFAPRFTEAGLTKLAQKKGSEQIRYLSFKGCSISDEGLKLLAKFPALIELELSEMPLNGTGFDSLETHPRLSNLTLLSGRLTPEGIAAIGRMKSLRSLNIDGCPLTPKHVEGFKGSPLAELLVNSTQINDECVSILAQMPSLRALMAINNQLTDKSLIELQKVKSLEILKIQGNREIKENEIQAFVKAMPQVRIESDFGNFEPKKDSIK
jgi:serine/threonine protein kinase/WD40 repeat protein